MKKVKNWLGEYMEFEGSIGEAIANHTIKNLPGDYIYDDGFITLIADPEIPIKGLIILGTNKKVSSITEFSEMERHEIMNVSNRLIKCLHSLGIKKLIQYQDESSSGTYHIWFLPRHSWTLKYGDNIDDMVEYSKKKLNTSEEYKKELLNFIKKVKETI